MTKNYDKDKVLHAQVFQNKEDIDVILQEIGEPIQDWNNLSPEEYSNASLAYIALNLTHANPLEVAKQWKHADVEKTAAMIQYCEEENVRAGLPKRPTLQDFGGDEEAFATFKKSVLARALKVGSYVFRYHMNFLGEDNISH